MTDRTVNLPTGPHLPRRPEIGLPYPLGATWDGSGTNFAVFSGNAERIDLCLFDAAGRREIARYTLPEYTDEVWHGYLPGVRAGQLYGYRATAPTSRSDGHRFNPNKLLLDPYARELAGELRWTDALFGYRLNSPRADLSLRPPRQRAGHAQGAWSPSTHFNWGDDRPRTCRGATR